jgi:tRNA/tmRNA/rRNA uracil-C5-methylase (TrmA/RlmC/RlmD family)
MIRSVTIVNLAPTGEGVAKTPEGVGFVAGALPGEQVEAEVLEVRKRFWKGRAVSIAARSPLRRSGAHADGCAGCDWSYFDVDAARQAKRELFLETMARIGGLPASPFGDLPIEPSPLAYRLRSRFHCSGRGEGARVGYFAPRTHRVESAGDCEALSESLRGLLPQLAEAAASAGASVAEIATVEDLSGSRRLARATLPGESDRRNANAVLDALSGLFDGVAVASVEGPILAARGERRLWLPAAGREFPLTAATFFQVNRHLLSSLYGEIAREAASAGTGRALDLFGGVGFFAGALLDAGHEVVSVEANHAAVEQAAAARKRWRAREAVWRIEHAEALAFLDRNRETFELAVADPPRAGLGLPLCRALAGRVGRLLYVSCEPATLARDLEALVVAGLHIRSGKLYDLFPLTHRVEAVVALSPPRTP